MLSLKYLRVLRAAVEVLPDCSILFLILGNSLYCHFNVDHEIHFVKFLEVLVCF